MSENNMEEGTVRDENINDLIERCDNRLSLLRNKILEAGKNIQTVTTAADANKQSLLRDRDQVKDIISKVVDASYENLLSAIEETCLKDIQNIHNVEECLKNDLRKGEKLIQDTKDSNNSYSDLLHEVDQWLIEVNKGPSEVPVVSLSLGTKINESNLSTVETKARDILMVSMTGSVQIVECAERPGAIIVSWDEQQVSDSESVTTDTSHITEYILQYAKEGEDVFHTLYEGEDMSYTMKPAEPNHIYSFRVCRYNISAGHEGCGPWSMTKQASTMLLPHAWRISDGETESGLRLYQISNKGRTSTKVFPESSQFLRSQGASYRLGEALTFQIEETGENSNNDGLGFILHESEGNKLLPQFKNAAIMNTRGCVVVNGIQMTTKLPAVKRNSVAVFHAVRNSSGKLRVSISVDDKEVTFDWNTVDYSKDTLYFACRFEHTGWQVSVS